MSESLQRVGAGIAWTLALVLLALGGAGIVAQWSHPPGTAAREELTWAGDQAMRPELSGAQSDLAAIAADVDRLSVLARGALASVTADQQAAFQAALGDGTDLAAAIRDASAALRARLAALPGDAPADRISHGGEALGRRAAMLEAIGATEGLGRSWALLTSGSLAASEVIDLLTSHDVTVASAAAE
ncbi:MAG: hypothetical protein ABIV26_07170, partial [Candidatus Limnocylindrales bacterium]